MKNKIRLSIVSYLNSKPFLYGLFRHNLDQEVDLSLDIPADCAQKLLSNQADLGLVPVAILPQLAHYELISDYCIGASSPVKTVCIYSQCPIEEIETLYLDYQSRSSVALAQVLLKKHWKLSPKIAQASSGYIQKLGGKTAGVVIGDRCMGLEKDFAYTYDLAEVWMQYSGLPFVFAAWVANKTLAPSFVQKFNAALTEGLNQRQQLLALLPPQKQFSLEEYYYKNIDYQLDEAKRKGLEKFLQEGVELGLL
ncbi:putative periplasmic solute-binding protein [Saprospira grandis DSM 2844]|uniref:Chorismate dehydratase n=1 Tax=Saprospira grandis DSM 2844 TaxID=694433 RepID=J1I6Z5_9BACT|nr:menaquinone biosynthesis protein [Saprospira grandis]EJF54595.1 putative periplasmic solute-binding protein [Saprospira grandis DSM 2844]